MANSPSGITANIGGQIMQATQVAIQRMGASAAATPRTRTTRTSNAWSQANPANATTITNADGTHIQLESSRFECKLCRGQEMCAHMVKFFDLRTERNFFPLIPPDERVIYMPLAKGHAWIPVYVRLESGEVFGDTRTTLYLTATVRERGIKGKKFEMMIDPNEGLAPIMASVEGFYSHRDDKNYQYIADRISGQHLIPRNQRNILPCPGNTNHLGFKSEELFQRKFNGTTQSHHDIIVAEVACMAINGCCAECFIALELQGSADFDASW